eukprot:2376829-Rhodomonas_salina.2
MCGTEIAYAATTGVPCGVRYCPICLRACYCMSGTDLVCVCCSYSISLCNVRYWHSVWRYYGSAMRCADAVLRECMAELPGIASSLADSSASPVQHTLAQYRTPHRERIG